MLNDNAEADDDSEGASTGGAFVERPAADYSHWASS